jgi:putative membrane protein
MRRDKVMSFTKDGAVWKSTLAGAAGGLVGSLAMNQFQALVTEEPQSSSGGDDATVKTAQAISHRVFDHNLTKDEKKWSGPAVHYAFGALAGALYGLLAETVPGVASGGGTVFGAALWLAADEIGVPAFGLGHSPLKTPASSHIKALASHLVFGLTTGLTRQTVQRVTQR